MFRLLLSLTLLSSIAQAQEITPHVINSGGGSALVSGNIVEWNMGEAQHKDVKVVDSEEVRY